MACLCKQIAGEDIELSPTCIGDAWIFQNLEAEEVEALSHEAFREKSTRAKRCFCREIRSIKCFLSKADALNFPKCLKTAQN
jgi:hypothetical protein